VVILQYDDLIGLRVELQDCGRNRAMPMRDVASGIKAAKYSVL
jgi:hypothetical protein